MRRRNSLPALHEVLYTCMGLVCLILFQLMSSQQSALMTAIQGGGNGMGGYLNTIPSLPAAPMSSITPISVPNGLATPTITPSSGQFCTGKDNDCIYDVLSNCLAVHGFIELD